MQTKEKTEAMNQLPEETLIRIGGGNSPLDDDYEVIYRKEGEEVEPLSRPGDYAAPLV